MIRLRLQRSLAINGQWHNAGDVIEADGGLADSLLRTGTAVPVDPVNGRAWWETPRRPWVSSWPSR